ERKREDALIVGNRAVGLKRALCFAIQLVGVCDLADATYRQLSGQAKCFTRRLIGQLMDGKLAKGLSRKGNLTDVVAGSIGHFKRAPERVGLGGCRLQFQMEGELHLASLLLLNRVLDRFGRDVSGATDIVRTTPQRRQARTQMWELIAQDAGGE